MSAQKILLGLTGSVASIKAQQLAKHLSRHGEVQIVSTRFANHFLEKLSQEFTVHTDEHEWNDWKKIGDPVLHIELRKWADVFLIAPCSANTLAKIATGSCDNLLTSVARAWDFTKPFLIAPAMNTMMWSHPITNEHISKVQSWGIQIIEPIVKELACQDVGIGAMEEPEEIATLVSRLISEQE